MRFVRVCKMAVTFPGHRDERHEAQDQLPPFGKRRQSDGEQAQQHSKCGRFRRRDQESTERASVHRRTCREPTW